MEAPLAHSSRRRSCLYATHPISPQNGHSHYTVPDTLQYSPGEGCSEKEKKTSWCSSIGNATSHFFTGQSSEKISSKLSKAIKEDTSNNIVLGSLKAVARVGALIIGATLNTVGRAVSFVASTLASAIPTAIIFASLVGIIIWIFCEDLSKNIHTFGTACGEYLSMPFSFMSAACINSATSEKDSPDQTYSNIQESNSTIAAVGGGVGIILGMFARIIFDLATQKD
jgi:hypothetical protein